MRGRKRGIVEIIVAIEFLQMEADENEACNSFYSLQ